MATSIWRASPAFRCHATATRLREAATVGPRAFRGETSDHFINSTTVANAHLQLLGDVFAVPASWPVVHNVFSVGDICLVVGTAMLLHGVCGSRLVRLRIVRR